MGGSVISVFIIYQCYVYRTNIRHIPPEVAWECDTTSVIRRDECDTMQIVWGNFFEISIFRVVKVGPNALAYLQDL